MDLTGPGAAEDLRAAVAGAAAVTAVGSRTHWEVGGPPWPAGLAVEVRAPAGILRHDPDELTVSVGAATSCADLASALGAAGQECPLDPREPEATVGGVLACGLSGLRRLRRGPLRDRVLEVQFVTGDGRLVRGGGPTVKNVTGFDLPRLFVGSLGTIGVLTRAILRVDPLPASSCWYSAASPWGLRVALHRPSAILWDGRTTTVLLEGERADLDAQARAADLVPVPGPPPWPVGAHRGRVSLPPGALRELGRVLAGVEGLTWLAEIGVGTVHVAAPSAGALLDARAAATGLDGWLLREAGLPGDDGFGRALPAAVVGARLRAAFDPRGVLAGPRLPVGAAPPVEVEG